MTDVDSSAHELRGNPHGGLARTVGFWGLMSVSLGSIIGSGWLLSALNATTIAGPAAILSWVLAALMLTVLALVYAELGATYPVAGGTARFPYFSHGPITGFFSGWMSWIQAVLIAPVEVVAAIAYANSTAWVQNHFNMIDANSNLNGNGKIVALIGMILFTAINLAGAEFMSESNTWIVVWKTLVPLLAIITIAVLSFHPSNLHAGGGFMPHGFHGVLAALPGGVVFALQGFEQAVQLAGEAKNPQKDLSRAIIVAMGIGAMLYVLLQLIFVTGVSPAHVAENWNDPLGGGKVDVGAWYTLAVAAGAGWLAKVILVDAIISPAGTGIVYLGTTARISYALGEEEEVPAFLSATNKRNVPYISILLASILGYLSITILPSWGALVAVITGATAVMYALAPVALGALQERDGDRPRNYRMPFPKVLLPMAFAFSSLLVYWDGWNVNKGLLFAILVGGVLYAWGMGVKLTRDRQKIKHALWILPWILGLDLLSFMGNYGIDGDGHKGWLPATGQLDGLIVMVFSVAMYYLGVQTAMSKEDIQAAISVDLPAVEGASA